MAKVGEEMFFFAGTGGRRLLGFLHHPRGKLSGALVYCHPFAEEKNQSHVIAARTARRLAQDGIAVLRFDFSGCGDSEGNLEEASADDWIAEIGLAAAVLKEKTGARTLGYWGLRAGANLAARHAAEAPDAAFAMLWQPVADLKTHIHQFLRQKLATGMASASGEALSVKSMVKQLEAGETVEVMGYPISPRLYASLASRAEGPAAREYRFPVGVFAFGDADAPPDALQRMAESLRTSRGPGALVHVREEPFWDRYWRWESAPVAESAAGWVASVL